MKKIIRFLGLLIMSSLFLTGCDNSSDVSIQDVQKTVDYGKGRIDYVNENNDLYTYGLSCSQSYNNISINPSEYTENLIITDVKCIDSGPYNIGIIRNDNTLWMYGINQNGELGNASNDNSELPVKIMDDVAFVSVGYNHIAAIKKDGSLWIWGNNEYGQLGNGTKESSNIPIKIMDNVISVAAGSRHTVAVTNSGGVWSWGSNTDGQLGIETDEEYALSPVDTHFWANYVVAGDNHTVAMRSDGSVWTWGNNEYCQLGINIDHTNSGYNNSIPDNLKSPNQIIESGAKNINADQYRTYVIGDLTTHLYGIPQQDIFHMTQTEKLKNCHSEHASTVWTAFFNDWGTCYAIPAGNGGILISADYGTIIEGIKNPQININ